ncbi:uncharacterized protein LOC127944598 isoform X3 [Carassius gibelio]|uniref:uncharacterized protein LOC127944598 isoform X3 n=1 Tax=Carassius gibelio TaxID=101364 RepID=UPI002279B99E|nr:uncharacterized protein LOC127944598 isoform X3 [Carassius gibelio]
MAISTWIFILFFTSVKVCGQADAPKSVRVMEGDVLRLHPGVPELKEDVQILWSYERGNLSHRIAQKYQGKIYTHYDQKFSGRVQLDQKTGVLTISNIRTNESGPFEALLVINRQISKRKFSVDVYAVSSVTVQQSTGTSHASNTSCTHPTNKDCVDHCGISEALVRLVLSGLVGIATVLLLVEHLRFCSSQRRAVSSV